MSKFPKLVLVLALLLAGLTGCHTPPDPPSPGETITPGGSRTSFDPSLSGSESLPTRDGGVAIPDDLMERIRTNTLRPEDILVTVYFDFDQFSIKASERPGLVAAAGVLAANPPMNVVAVGHTDSIGAEQYNLGLSDRRAVAVQNFMISNQAGANQIQILALGMLNSVPGVTKDSPEAQKDRRVDVVKIPAGAGR